MGRPSHTRQLAVWMNGERVGDWRVPGRGPQEFVYDPAWLSSPQFRPLSLSLPVGLGAPALRGDLRCFFQAQVLFWMLRAIDGHAKNFSLFLLPGGSYRLTPLYDVLSAWPVIGKAAGQWPEQELRLAMAWHGRRSRTSEPRQVQRRHLISTASRMGLAAEAEALVANLVARTPEVIATMRQELPSGFPEPLADAILAGLQGSAEGLVRQLP